MNDTTKFWEGAFGDDYLIRNRVNWRERVPFWRFILNLTRPDCVMEVGCNAGWNLRAIRDASPGTSLIGVDVNAAAIREAKRNGFDAYLKPALGINDFDMEANMVITAGVLIHVPPEDLRATMQAIVDRTTKHVVAVEYEADEEQEIEYRGHAGKLWKRPYGKLYEELGLKPVFDGAAGGFDQCTYWLMEKP